MADDDRSDDRKGGDRGKGGGGEKQPQRARYFSDFDSFKSSGSEELASDKSFRWRLAKTTAMIPARNIARKLGDTKFLDSALKELERIGGPTGVAVAAAIAAAGIQVPDFLKRWGSKIGLPPQFSSLADEFVDQVFNDLAATQLAMGKNFSGKDADRIISDAERTLENKIKNMPIPVLEKFEDLFVRLAQPERRALLKVLGDIESDATLRDRFAALRVRIHDIEFLVNMISPKEVAKSADGTVVYTWKTQKEVVDELELVLGKPASPVQAVIGGIEKILVDVDKRVRKHLAPPGGPNDPDPFVEWVNGPNASFKRRRSQ